MDTEKNANKYQKMSSFIDKLIQNKSFENQSLVAKEDSILRFFVKNEAQLKPNFTSGDYFPDMDWDNIKALFFTVLRDYIIEQLNPEINLIGECINFSVVRVVAEGPLDDYKTTVLEYYQKLMTHKEVRGDFDSVYKGVTLGYIKKYLEGFRLRGGYGSKELFKYRQLQDTDDFSHFLKICLIIRSIFRARIPVAEPSGKIKNVNYESSRSHPLLKREYLKKVNELIKSQLNHLPELFIKISINSVLDMDDSASEIEAVSMFLKIIAERSKAAVMNQRVDKGAETPDKSWFNIARRNANYYGFDTRILDEFYIIATELNL